MPLGGSVAAPARRLPGYGLALAAGAVALGLQCVLAGLIGPGLFPYLTFYPALMAVAILAGCGPGVVATAAAALTAAGAALSMPFGQVSGTSPAERVTLATFLVTGLLVSAIAEFYRRRRGRLAALEAQTHRQTLFESEQREQAQRGQLEAVRQTNLQAANGRLAAFALEQDRASKAERKHLARQVDDLIGQVLTAIQLIVDFCHEATQACPQSCEVDIDAQSVLDATQSLLLFRITQEAMTNVLRHAGAKHVETARARCAAALATKGLTVDRPASLF